MKWPALVHLLRTQLVAISDLEEAGEYVRPKIALKVGNLFARIDEEYRRDNGKAFCGGYVAFIAASDDAKPFTALLNLLNTGY